jgi:dienelactone hydrolase
VTLPDHDPARSAPYDPFARGVFPVGVLTARARDDQRDRNFNVELWYPAAASYAGEDLSDSSQDTFAAPAGGAAWRQAAVRAVPAGEGRFPWVIFSHPSASHRRSLHSLCTHLSSHGYVVAAMDHSESFAPDLTRPASETPDQRAARVQRIIGSRVPDLRFLLDWLQHGGAYDLPGAALDVEHGALVGHSFGGWAVLAAADVDARVGAVVALAPGGGSRPRPGVLPLTLSFTSPRRIPTLYLVAEDDVTLPLDGLIDLYERAPAPKCCLSLQGADHYHFMDHAAEIHEAVRTMPLPDELRWMQAMRPMTGLCSEQVAHDFVRGLTLCHLDAVLKRNADAERFMDTGIESHLAARGIPARRVR